MKIYPRCMLSYGVQGAGNEAGISVTSFPQTEEARAELAKGITEVVHKVTEIPSENIWVVFEPMPKDSWSAGGTLISKMK